MMTVDTVRFDFAEVERRVARCDPDPDGNRQQQATAHGTIVAAPWLATVLDVDRRRVLRWRIRGVGYWDADEIATRLGLYPTALWPEWSNVEIMADRRADALAESEQLRLVLT